MFLFQINSHFLSKDSIKILPRNNLVCVIIESQHNELKILAIDRKPKIYPETDISLVKYIIVKNENITLFINGNCGIALLDEISKNRKIESYQISLSNINKINKIIKIKDKFVQIISI